MDHNEVKAAILESGILDNPPSDVILLFNSTNSVAAVLSDGFMVLRAKENPTDAESNLLWEVCEQLVLHGFGGLAVEASNTKVAMTLAGYRKSSQEPDFVPLHKSEPPEVSE